MFESTAQCKRRLKAFYPSVNRFKTSSPCDEISSLTFKRVFYMQMDGAPALLYCLKPCCKYHLVVSFPQQCHNGISVNH